MDDPSADWLRMLPEGVPPAARATIAGFTAHVTEETSCVVTGSLVEGLGNAHSDVDFYLIQADDAPTRPVSIGLRGTRYVDCEYLGVGTVTQLVERFVDDSAAALLARRQRDFDRYYRLAIGIQLVTTDEVTSLLRRCAKERACVRFAEWAWLLAYRHLARAAVAHALGQPRRAQLLLREAALWRASRVLAEAGEGYPSLKWTEAKAARRFGAGSAEYRDCLDGYLDAADDPAAELARLRGRLDPPALALSAMSERQWELADQVDLLTAGTDLLLVRGRKQITQITGVIAPIVTRLAVGKSAPDAVAEVAAELSVPTDEVLAASFDHLHSLQEAGYLAAAGTGAEEG